MMETFSSSSGILPVITLPVKINSSSVIMLPISDGMELVSELF